MIRRFKVRLVDFGAPKEQIQVITSDDLAKLAIRRVIFHDVPRNPRRGSNEPILMDEETEVDPARRALLKTKLTRVINSKRAYPIGFDPDTSSPVPGHVRVYTKNHDATEFIPMSQKVAMHLFDIQHGGISPGLLCAVDVVAGGLAGLVLMKLEREEGARLELVQSPKGKRAFAMSVLDNLVLTDGTRLFKTGMFLRTGAGDDDFRAAACDT